MIRKHALLIGVSEYDDSDIPDLNKPLQDVTGFAKVLKNSNIGGFTGKNIKTLINPACKTAKRGIAHFFIGKKRDDLVLFYFAGHGFRDKKELYLAVRDTEKNYLDAEAVSASFIANQMSKCRAKSQVLILDCCHSGAFNVPPGMTAPGINAVILTASDTTEQAWETGDNKNSLFTHHLIEGLRTGIAGFNKNGRITVEELYEYIRSQLKTFKQNPLRLYPFGRQEEQIVIAGDTASCNEEDTYGKIEFKNEKDEILKYQRLKHVRVKEKIKNKKEILLTAIYFILAVLLMVSFFKTEYILKIISGKTIFSDIDTNEPIISIQHVKFILQLLFFAVIGFDLVLFFNEIKKLIKRD